MLWRFNNELPIYTQIVEQIKLAIVSGELLPGARMTAVRDLALEAGVNPNTMQRALQQLEREGLVYTQRSSGRFVTEDLTTIARTRDALAADHVARFREAMEGLGYSEQEMIGLLKGRKEEEDGKLS